MIILFAVHLVAQIDVNIENSILTVSGEGNVGPEDIEPFLHTQPFDSIVIQGKIHTISPETFKNLSIKHLTLINSEITSIGDFSFAYNHITDIDFPDTLVEIKRCAFMENKDMTIAKFKEGLIEIDDKAFYGCNVKNIQLPDSLEELGDGAFGKCGARNLTFGSNIHTIGSECFTNLYVSDLILPNTITEIKYRTFASSGFKTVHFGNSITTIGEEAFVDGSLEALTLPDTITSIGNRCFSSNKYMKTLKLSNKIKEIPYRAFDNSIIEYVDLPNSVTKICGYAFDCCKLSQVRFGPFIEEIGNFAFSRNQLTSISLPPSLHRILDETFYYNGKLQEVIFGDKLTYIGKNTFSNCDLLSIKFSKSLKYINTSAFYGNRHLHTVDFGESLEFIDDMAFYGCNISKIKFPDTLKYIDMRAFFSNSYLTEVDFGNNIEVIGNRSFEYCSNLRIIKVPSTLKQIRHYAFDCCDKLETVIYCGDKFMSSDIGSFYYKAKIVVSASYKFEKCFGRNVTVDTVGDICPVIPSPPQATPSETPRQTDIPPKQEDDKFTAGTIVVIFVVPIVVIGVIVVIVFRKNVFNLQSKPLISIDSDSLESQSTDLRPF